jgi:hypothetical protein
MAKKYRVADGFIVYGKVGGAIEGLVYPLIGSTTSLVIKPNGTAVGTANPSYTMTPLVTEWTPVNGAVGELATASITWPISGTVTKAVA